MGDLLQSSTGSDIEQLTITDAARAELRGLTGPLNCCLRLCVWVKPGGYSGLSYHAAPDDTPGPFDVQVYYSA